MSQTFRKENMKNYMNKSVDKSWTNEDVKADYELYKDIKLVARRYSCKTKICQRRCFVCSGV